MIITGGGILGDVRGAVFILTPTNQPAVLSFDRL